MAKARRKRGKAVPAVAFRRGPPTAVLVVLLVLGAAAAFGLWSWYDEAERERAFLALADAGRSAMAGVERRPDLGGGHVAPGQAVGYGTAFPTSGRHDPDPLDAGVYDRPQRPEEIVHALEHGIVVIYYDRPGEAAMAAIREWAALYPGPWDGVAAVPKEGLGEAVVLTAWNRLLRLDRFEPAAAAAFIDTFRGRGPEHPVR